MKLPDFEGSFTEVDDLVIRAYQARDSGAARSEYATHRHGRPQSIADQRRNGVRR